MKVIRIILVCLAVFGSVHGQEISVPERPADHLLDETGKATAAERAALKAELDKAESATGLRVSVVLLNAAPEEPPMDLARRLAENWKGDADGAVVISGAGMSPPLVIAVAGKSADVELTRMTEVAVAAAASAEPGLAAAREAAKSLVSQVAAFRAGKDPAPPAAVAVVAGWDNYLPAWLAAGVLLCCLVLLLVMRRGRRSALIFPQAAFRHRFSAPHSGGNDSVVYFGKSGQ